MSAVPALIRRLRSRRRLEQREAAEQLYDLSFDRKLSNEEFEMLLEAGSISLLLELVRTSLPAVQQPSAHALGSLMRRSPAVLEAAMAADGLNVLAERLCSDNSSPEVLVAMLYSLTALMADRTERRAALAAVPGVLPRLVQMLGGSAGGEGSGVCCRSASPAGGRLRAAPMPRYLSDGRWHANGSCVSL